MKEKSIGLFEFQKQFGKEEDCEQAIVKARWPKGFVCPKCNHDDGYRLRTKRAIQCAVCRHQISITAGTIFHNTRISLVNWFWMIYQIASDKRGVSALRLSKELGMYYRTVWHILHKIRRSMSGRDNSVIRLAGLIELDQGYFGGKHRKTQVLVAIEQEGKKKAGNLVMKKIFGKLVSEPEVKRIVEAHIDNESQQHFVTDCASAHETLRKMGHKLENHLSTPETAAKKLPLVHLAISLAKTFILGTYHGVSKKHLQNYLDEFCYRFNRRPKENQLHESLIRACILAAPINYAALRL